MLIFIIIAIIGAIFVSTNRPLIANYLWSISNAGILIYNISINEYEMSLLFGVYEIIAIFGIYNLRKNK